ADREEAPLVRERLRLRPRLGDDLHRLLEAVAVLLLWHVVAAELRRAIAAAEPDLQPAARDDVHERRLLGQAQRMMEGQDRRRQPDAYPPRPGGGDGGERAGVHREAVVDEVVLGEPDLVEAQLLRPLHLLELAVHDLGVAEARCGLEEEERAEAHGSAPDASEGLLTRQSTGRARQTRGAPGGAQPLRSFGSSASLSESPKRLKPNTPRLIAMPGNRAIHGAFSAYEGAEPDSINPHDGVGSAAPSPK